MTLMFQVSYVVDATQHGKIQLSCIAGVDGYGFSSKVAVAAQCRLRESPRRGSVPCQAVLVVLVVSLTTRTTRARVVQPHALRLMHQDLHISCSCNVCPGIDGLLLSA